ncbi:hypothetical protein OIT44_05140 [Weissella ceti]|uniref:Uncharacterized protein n=1 Tax=Weissella ceti TaxID=759620 RepID=A0ABT3E5E0_9LACO|nr:hypothetical protein [Weissella ceti]MCW0953454.1 hypothetical protein [Weissella ceti]QVK12056.1 hypothetical protein KHQ31_07585 [Weissella ceti]
MTKKFKIAALICTASCLFNLTSASLITPAQASNHAPLLSEVTDSLPDLTEVRSLTDLQEDMLHLTDNLADLHAAPVSAHKSTAASKLWIGNMWIKTWIWTQLRK